MAEGVLTPTIDRVGIPGIEARHVIAGRIGLGYMDDWPEPGLTIRQLSGLHDRPDADDVRENPAGIDYEIARPSQLRGKTVVYEGMVRARSLVDLRWMEKRVSSLLATTQLLDVVISTHPDQPFHAFRYKARPVQAQVGDAQGSPMGVALGYERGYIIGLRLVDPRIYRLDPIFASTAPLAGIGGISAPLRTPLVIPNAGAGASMRVVNEGDAPSSPIIDVYGPVTNPVLFNDTLGVSLVFSNLFLGSDDFIRIDFDRRTIMLDGTSDYKSRLVRSASTWWRSGVPGLVGNQEWQGEQYDGTNDLRLQGDNLTDPARAELRGFHAYH